MTRITKAELRRRFVLELIKARHPSPPERAPRAAFGQRTGLSASYVSRILSEPGAPGHRAIGEEMAQQIEQAYSLTPGVLQFPEAMSRAVIDSVRRFTPRGLRDVPVYALDGLSAAFPTGGEHVVREPEKQYAELQTDDPRDFIVRVEGQAMAPRFWHGEYLHVEVGHMPQEGDDVVVIFKDGTAEVRRLLSTTGGVRLGDYASGRVSNHVQAELEAVYFVAGRVPVHRIKNR